MAMPTDASLDQVEEAGAALQLRRYQFAAKYVQAGNLLDIACGDGSGACWLRQECSQLGAITGVDLSVTAIGHAQQHFADPGMHFIVEDAMRYWDSAGFTNIVSLGTLEFLLDPRKFMMRTAGMLRNGGTFVASAPVTPSMDINPQHRSDFTEFDLRALAAESDLIETACLTQVESFAPASLTADYYKANPVKLLSRIGSMLRNGFKTRYLTIAWTKRA